MLRLIYIGKVFLTKLQATMKDNVLAFYTLGGMTQIESFIFVPCHPSTLLLSLAIGLYHPLDGVINPEYK